MAKVIVTASVLGRESQAKRAIHHRVGQPEGGLSGALPVPAHSLSGAEITRVSVIGQGVRPAPLLLVISDPQEVAFVRAYQALNTHARLAFLVRLEGDLVGPGHDRTRQIVRGLLGRLDSERGVLR